VEAFQAMRSWLREERWKLFILIVTRSQLHRIPQYG
jgi:hypothetical protein